MMADDRHRLKTAAGILAAELEAFDEDWLDELHGTWRDEHGRELPWHREHCLYAMAWGMVIDWHREGLDIPMTHGGLRAAAMSYLDDFGD